MNTTPRRRRAVALGQMVRKAADRGGERWEGVASSYDLDRQGERIVPEALMSSFERTGPLPLLWCHHTDEPVGMIDTAELRDGTVWTAGTLLPPTASPRCSLAHACLDMGTAMGLSVGFNPVGDGYEKGEDGEVVWTELEWLETSVVAVPANAATSYGPAQARELDAVAYAVKALDAGYDITRPWMSEQQNADWLKRVELRKAAEEIAAEMDGWRTRYPRPAPRTAAQERRQAEAPSAPVDLIALAEARRITWQEAHARCNAWRDGYERRGWRGPVTATGKGEAREVLQARQLFRPSPLEAVALAFIERQASVPPPLLSNPPTTSADVRQRKAEREALLSERFVDYARAHGIDTSDPRAALREVPRTGMWGFLAGDWQHAIDGRRS